MQLSIRLLIFLLLVFFRIVLLGISEDRIPNNNSSMGL